YQDRRRQRVRADRHRLSVLRSGPGFPLLHLRQPAHRGELIGDGSGLLVPLVRWLRGGKNFRADRVPAVPEGDDHFRGKVFHRFAGSVRIGPGSRCHLLHGVGAAEVIDSRTKGRNHLHAPPTPIWGTFRNSLTFYFSY
uniref:Uncharacterized protein n=1 Tax=Anopheles atroparvus TaxID=41427 RepID=A0AAG5CZT4_ANOAO